MKSGDVLLISGRSRGVGTATARLAAARAYKVAVNYRDREDAALEVVSGIASAGGYAIAIQGEVAQESDVERVFAELDQRVGPIAGLQSAKATLNRNVESSAESREVEAESSFSASHNFDALSGHELLNNEFVEVVDTHEDWLATVTGLHSLIKKYHRQSH